MPIEILQPKPFDLVGSTILIAGNANAFEGQMTIRVSEGHDEYTGLATVGSLSTQQFQASITIPDNHAFQLNRIFVTLIDDSGGGDGVPPPTATVSVLFGPMIYPGYVGYWEHTVVPGDTLSKISARYYEGDSSQYPAIHQANQHIVTNPNLILPGQVLRIPRDF
ncbi:MAG: LysM peptidoglycan-binding domain-containing protein [Rhizobiaceae bacterium]